MPNRAVHCKIIQYNPIAGVKPPRNLTSRPPRWFTREELSRIYAVELEIPPSTTPADRQMHIWYRWTWQLMANTGLRRGEAQHLEWRDIGAQEIGIRSEEDARTKSGRWRSVPISAGAHQSLSELRRVATGRHVCPEIAPRSLSRAFERTLGRSAISGCMHDLRHTYCSHLVMAGVPLRTVQILAGHASYTTTERYAHLAPSTLRDAIAALSL